MSTRRFSGMSLLLLLLCLFSLTPHSSAIKSYANVLVPYVESNGEKVYLRDFRQPGLYTGDFADCRGDSLIDFSRFDVAYYKDNSTVTFHLEGHTALQNQSVTVSILVYAYGTTRYELIFDPCNANINNLCPMNSNATILANGVIPIAPDKVSLIPSIALSVPDFEGQAILRIYANSTQSEIACYLAVVTNGRTFSQPVAIGTALGAITLVAVIASFATAIYYDSIGVTRKHYAHSISILVIFEVFQSIYFTGALSMNWPSVLPAFWSNYAWAAGMIYARPVESSITNFLGGNKIDISRVGAAATGNNNDAVAGGYNIAAIYSRSASSLFKRALPSVADGYPWYGSQITNDLPLPGNFSGFAGTLSPEGIPMSNAFLTGLIWFLIILAAVLVLVPLFKWILEGFALLYLVQRDSLTFFRKHWVGYSIFAALRTIFMAFFMITFLSLLQLSSGTGAHVTAVAAVVLIIFSFGVMTVASYAYFSELRSSWHMAELDNEAAENTTTTNLLESANDPAETSPEVIEDPQESPKKWKMPFTKKSQPYVEKQAVHEKPNFTKRYGWLASRYRKSKWWFFVAWLLYQFVRACFLAGAVFRPKVQVFGLLAIEILGFIGMIIVRPYEGQRLNAIAVYFLGFSKVACTALSAAFDTSFKLERITATVIGIVIIVIQAILTILLIIAIVAGFMSTYASLTRNHEHFTPKKMKNARARYFRHLDRSALEAPREKKSSKEEQALMESDMPQPHKLPGLEPEAPKEPYFRIGSIRRVRKIEDDDDDFSSDIDDGGLPELHSEGREILKRKNTQNTITSMHSYKSRHTLPYGARKHRSSWSTKEFETFDEQGEHDVISGTSPSTSGVYVRRNGSRGYDAVGVREMNLLPPIPNIPSSPLMIQEDLTLPTDLPSVRPASAHELSIGLEVQSHELESPSGTDMDRTVDQVELPAVRH